MRRSAEFDEQHIELENETQEEPKAKKDRSHERTTNIATLDNGTLVEALKYLNYCGLAKNSLVSKKFCSLICTNRHRLALLDVDEISMVHRWDLHGSYTKCDYIEAFNKQHSGEEYNEWVIRNNYSKQIPLEGQVVEIQRSQYQRTFYELTADAYYKDQFSSVFFTCKEFNHENWPVFQHFVRLVTDPFIYIRLMELTPQNNVSNLLAGAVNSNRDRLKCKKLIFNLQINSQKVMSWIKGHVVCDKLKIYGERSEIRGSNFDEELLNFFMAGASCTSKISAKEYDLSYVIRDFVQKFMELKKFDQSQIVQSIKSNHAHRVLSVMKLNYAEFIVKEEMEEEKETAVTIFEFINSDVGKKMEITLETTACGSECEEETCFSLQMENL